MPDDGPSSSRGSAASGPLLDLVHLTLQLLLLGVATLHKHRGHHSPCNQDDSTDGADRDTRLLTTSQAPAVAITSRRQRRDRVGPCVGIGCKARRLISLDPRRCVTLCQLQGLHLFTRRRAGIGLPDQRRFFLGVLNAANE